ncbi:MAG: bifunctional 5,10-methylenetetrahydrofolate dehydrogenase/5,10-methenyltetrahydrofolate cyclohydrolase [Patescibacteria group bacterium]|nr:bifunctional 5,10-methylenetetrahydrofolate dehydrogenase/5,10-methenyltetrahydrofolate cyclohydrolase [Patescibacteria group bacterium]
MTQIIDGKALSKKIQVDLKNKVAKLKVKPGLAVVLIGKDSASEIYVRCKEETCEKIGYYSKKVELAATITKEELFKVIDDLNKDEKIDGILVQFPLPGELRLIEDEVIKRILPEKDVDGFHPLNVGELFARKKPVDDNMVVSCTPMGILRMLKEYKIEIKGKKAVVIGRSNLVGKPVAQLLLLENATVTICHSKTQDLEKECQQADILVVGVGKAGLIKKSFVKEGAVIIDAGINRTEKGLVGDVDYKGVFDKVRAITPVPGGVGPMTIAILMENVYKLYQRKNNEKSN